MIVALLSLSRQHKMGFNPKMEQVVGLLLEDAI
jgi:hypothetical protein